MLFLVGRKRFLTGPAGWNWPTWWLASGRGRTARCAWRNISRRTWVTPPPPHPRPLPLPVLGSMKPSTRLETTETQNIQLVIIFPQKDTKSIKSFLCNQRVTELFVWTKTNNKQARTALFFRTGTVELIHFFGDKHVLIYLDTGQDVALRHTDGREPCI